MGISELEFLDEDEDEAAGAGPEPGPPPRAAPRLPSPSAALLAALLAVVGAIGLAATWRGTSAGRFEPSVVSASFEVSADLGGEDLLLSLQNLGASMIEVTGVELPQPGLAARTDAAASPLDPLYAPLPAPVRPQQTALVRLPFHFNCAIATWPPVATSVRVSGYDARGNAHTASVPLPPGVSPWSLGTVLRPDFCAMPPPREDLAIQYGGVGPTLMEFEPIRFYYSIVLTAPTSSPVTVDSLVQDNAGIIATTDPLLPVTVLDGQTLRITVEWRVTSCLLSKRDAFADGVELYAANPRAAERWHAVLGAQFARDMANAIGAVCSGAPAGS